MQKLISELARLYLPPGASRDALAPRLLGQASGAIDLTTSDACTRAVVMTFPNDGKAQHWSHLCVVANALQAELGLPAPAVSVSGIDGYGLWLSLETPVPVSRAQEFVELLRLAYVPEMDSPAGAVGAPVELPPALIHSTGRWTAFIHPGMGSSFTEEAGLEMAPPLAGQAAFLEPLQSISEAQFQHARDLLRRAHGAAPPVANAMPAERTVDTGGLLLKDATLEDIVRFLHSKNIEPTFRHLLPK
jgi:hypothetical protein